MISAVGNTCFTMVFLSSLPFPSSYLDLKMERATIHMYIIHMHTVTAAWAEELLVGRLHSSSKTTLASW